jgi:hypothetical protein
MLGGCVVLLLESSDSSDREPITVTPVPSFELVLVERASAAADEGCCCLARFLTGGCTESISLLSSATGTASSFGDGDADDGAFLLVLDVLEDRFLLAIPCAGTVDDNADADADAADDDDDDDAMDLPGRAFDPDAPVLLPDATADPSLLLLVMVRAVYVVKACLLEDASIVRK